MIRTMKEKYEDLEMEVIEFETEDVITTSGAGEGGGSAWIDPNLNSNTNPIYKI